MDFGDKLRSMREKRGFSTTDLFKLSGVSQSYISDIENKRRLSPTKDVIEKLSKALRVSPMYFFDDDVVTPLDIIPNMPEDIREFLLEEESMSFLKLSQKAKKEGITPAMMENMLNILKDAMNVKK